LIIKLARNEFPNLDIVAGPWVNRVGHIRQMLDSGANAITKFPAIKLFNTKHAKTIEEEIKSAGYELNGTFTKMPTIDFEEIKNLSFDDNLKKEVIVKVKEYLAVMERN